MRKCVKKSFLPGHRMLPAMVCCAVILTVILVYSSAALALEEGEDEAIVRNLIEERTDAMNGFYASQLSYWEAAEILRNVEAGNLLKEDKDNLRYYFRTDIEEVKDYEIKEVRFSERSEEMLCANVDIIWNLEGIEGAETQDVTYRVICEKKGENFKLVQFF